MTGRLLALITTGVVTVLFAVAAIAAIGGAASTCTLPPSDGSASGYDTEQLHNAATIVQVAAVRGLPVRAAVIAVATAMQESNLYNAGQPTDHDSLGLFQQRPSQGWGTPEQLLNAEYAAGKFYDTLLTVTDWQTLPLTVVAQAVQRSAYGNAYAKHEADATAIVAHVGSESWRAIPENLEQCVGTCAAVSDRGSSSGLSVECPGGEAVLARAATWLTAWDGGPVPYLSGGDPSSWTGGYRRDCSGYASMALGLPGPGLTTAGLAARAAPIPKTALSPGDLLINPAPNLAGHVVIFDHWIDATLTSYVGYEQSGDGGTHHRVIPYPYFGDYPMRSYRWSMMRDSVTLSLLDVKRT